MERLLQFGWQKLARCFMAGLLAILPLVLTIAIVSWVAGFVRSYLGPETWVGRVIESIGFKLSRGWDGTRPTCWESRSSSRPFWL